MTVKEVLVEYMKDHDYDGLCNEWGGCACLIDDLAPCSGPMDECRFGVKAPCDCGEGCDFHVKEKQEGS